MYMSIYRYKYRMNVVNQEDKNGQKFCIFTYFILIQILKEL